jgi:hypothetical protein
MDVMEVNSNTANKRRHLAVRQVTRRSGATEQNARRTRCLLLAVRPEGAKHLWRKNPPRKLSIDLEANERLGRVTGRAGAS